MSDRPGGLIVDLHDVAPEPPDHLLGWERFRAAYRRQRARRQMTAVGSAAAATVAVVIGVTLVGGGTTGRPGISGARVVNGPLVFAQVRSGPATSLVNTDIAIADPDGSHAHALTADAGADEYAVATPDGTTIAYVEETATHVSAGSFGVHDVIRLMRADGSDNHLAYSCRSTCSDLSWSRDGRRLAFADDGIRVLDPDGSVRLVCGSSCGDALAEPSWSPDGSRLAFSQRGVLSQTGIGTPPSAIFVVHSDGSGLRRLTNRSCNEAGGNCTLDTGPTWSPDGSLLAFSRSTLPHDVTGQSPPSGPDGVFAMTPDGVRLHEVWKCPHQYCQAITPRWSPDGAHLAFVDPVRGGAHVVDVATRRAVAASPPAGGEGSGFTAVEWSPDGAALALTFADGTGPGALYTMAGDGTGLVRLAVPDVYASDRGLAWPAAPPATGPAPDRRTDSVPVAPTGEVAYKCGNDLCLIRPDGTGQRALLAAFPEWDPAWSPDGRRLAFRGYFTTAEGDYSIYIVDANGCRAHRLRVADGGTQPTWAPTGDRLAYALGGIDIVNADGTGHRQLTEDTNAWSDDSPSWSAVDRIAFVRTRGGHPSQVYVMNVDGSHVSALTRGRPGFDQPTWSPDARLIAFTAASVGPDGRSVVEVAKADGSGRRAVTPPDWTSYGPTWTPDGRIAFLVDRANGIDVYVVDPDGTGLHRLDLHLGGAGQSPQLAWGSSSLPPVRCR